MFPIFRTAKSLLFWSYGRSTWQYDILCALILAFVFLTPKTWFDEGKPKAHELHQNVLKAAERLLIWPENLRPAPDQKELERRARIMTGRSETRVRSVREVRDEGGQLVAYEVDIE